MKYVMLLLLLPSIAQGATCTRSITYRTSHSFAGLALMSIGAGQDFLREPNDGQPLGIRLDWNSIDIRSGNGLIYLNYRLGYKHFSIHKQTWIMPNRVETSIDVFGDFGSKVDYVGLYVSARQDRYGTTLQTWLTAHTRWGEGRGVFPRWRPIPRLVNRIALRMMPEELDDALAEIHGEVLATFAGRGRSLLVRTIESMRSR